jgi:hypothetical protein
MDGSRIVGDHLVDWASAHGPTLRWMAGVLRLEQHDRNGGAVSRATCNAAWADGRERCSPTAMAATTA